MGPDVEPAVVQSAGNMATGDAAKGQRVISFALLVESALKGTGVSAEGLSSHLHPIVAHVVSDEETGLALPEGLEFFVFPQGCNFAMSWTEPSYHSFVITLADGSQMYAFCVRKCFRVPEPVLETLRTDVTLSVPSKLFWTHAVVLVSRQPFLELLSTLLYKHCAPESVAAFNPKLLNFLFHLPLPNPALQLALSSLSSSSSSSAYSSLCPPSTAAYLCILLGLLEPFKVVTLLNALLSELPVLLLSSNLAVLTPALEALKTLLLPFRWPFLYIPVLPLSLCDMFEAPQPFLVGSAPEALHFLPQGSSVVVADLDQNLLYVHGPALRIRPPVPLAHSASSALHKGKAIAETAGVGASGPACSPRAGLLHSASWSGAEHGTARGSPVIPQNRRGSGGCSEKDHVPEAAREAAAVGTAADREKENSFSSALVTRIANPSKTALYPFDPHPALQALTVPVNQQQPRASQSLERVELNSLAEVITWRLLRVVLRYGDVFRSIHPSHELFLPPAIPLLSSPPQVLSSVANRGERVIPSTLLLALPSAQKELQKERKATGAHFENVPSTELPTEDPSLDAFAGSALVQWLLSRRFAATRAEAIALCRLLERERFVVCLNRPSYGFVDGEALYRMSLTGNGRQLTKQLQPPVASSSSKAVSPRKISARMAEASSALANLSNRSLDLVSAGKRDKSAGGGRMDGPKDGLVDGLGGPYTIRALRALHSGTDTSSEESADSLDEAGGYTAASSHASSKKNVSYPPDNGASPAAAGSGEKTPHRSKIKISPLRRVSVEKQTHIERSTLALETPGEGKHTMQEKKSDKAKKTLDSGDEAAASKEPGKSNSTSHVQSSAQSENTHDTQPSPYSSPASASLDTSAAASTAVARSVTSAAAAEGAEHTAEAAMSHEPLGALSNADFADPSALVAMVGGEEHRWVLEVDFARLKKLHCSFLAVWGSLVHGYGDWVVREATADSQQKPRFDRASFLALARPDYQPFLGRFVSSQTFKYFTQEHATSYRQANVPKDAKSGMTVSAQRQTDSAAVSKIEQFDKDWWQKIEELRRHRKRVRDRAFRANPVRGVFYKLGRRVASWKLRYFEMAPHGLTLRYYNFHPHLAEISRLYWRHKKLLRNGQVTSTAELHRAADLSSIRTQLLADNLQGSLTLEPGRTVLRISKPQLDLHPPPTPYVLEIVCPSRTLRCCAVSPRQRDRWIRAMRARIVPHPYVGRFTLCNAHDSSETPLQQEFRRLQEASYLSHLRATQAFVASITSSQSMENGRGDDPGPCLGQLQEHLADESKSSLDLHQILVIGAMLAENLDIQARNVGSRIFDRTFVAASAVKYMQAQTLVRSVEEALRVGNMLLQTAFIGSCSGSTAEFTNSNDLFYFHHLSAALKLSDAERLLLREMSKALIIEDHPKGRIDFTGEQAVEWMLTAQLARDEDDAVRIGNRLVSAGAIRGHASAAEFRNESSVSYQVVKESLAPRSSASEKSGGKDSFLFSVQGALGRVALRRLLRGLSARGFRRGSSLTPATSSGLDTGD
eukprot:g73886.t1